MPSASTTFAPVLKIVTTPSIAAAVIPLIAAVLISPTKEADVVLDDVTVVELITNVLLWVIVGFELPATVPWLAFQAVVPACTQVPK